ncbi:MAG: ribosome maturation factor RimM [Oscillospiraceae bacterium]|nr:ribosome maturation factor RimM [Oscillospiraceae bacterium]
MAKKFLEAGIIVNTHGLSGEVRILPWADSPGFLASFDVLYIDEQAVSIVSARVHKNMVIVALENVNDVDSAIKLKNKIVSIDRDEVTLDNGQYFIADLVGLRVLDNDTGAELGILHEVLSRPANNVYIVKGDREILIPAVDDFIMETNINDGYLKVRLIEGM